MIESTQNLQVVCEVFKKHIRAIRKKNKPQDPNFLKISIACGKIEQFIESIFPSQKPEDAIAKQKLNLTAKELAEKEKTAAAKEANNDVLYLGLAVFGTLTLLTLVMFGCAWLLGARFDIMFQQLKQGNFNPPPPGSLREEVVTKYDHGEL